MRERLDLSAIVDSLTGGKYPGYWINRDIKQLVTEIQACWAELDTNTEGAPKDSLNPTDQL